MARERPVRGAYRLLAACLALAALAAAGAPSRAEGVLAPAERQALLPRIVIHKSDRRLLYIEGDEIKHRFPVSLGKRPIGAKRERGDWRTPEGEYVVTYRKPLSRYHRFLGLSYPNVRDAEEGLRRGLISAEQLRQIRNAIGARAQPSWTTQLGSGIGIHGEGVYGDRKRDDGPEVPRGAGADKSLSIDWTDGCIALSDGDIETLYHLVPTGTPVVILP